MAREEVLLAWLEKFHNVLSANPIQPGEFFGMLQQIIRGLMYLHGKRILHMELSASNILLAKDNKIKISGLDSVGFSCHE